MSINDPVFSPHPWQGDILLSESKRKVVLTGRQSGKTTLLKTLIYAKAFERPYTEILVLAPTHGSVKELLWRHFVRPDEPLFPAPLVRYCNNQDMIIELVNGSRITFKGTENIDALLGREVDFLVIDEFQSHNPIVWTYLEPLLATRNGTAVFTGTARRGNHIMDYYNKGQSSPMWRSWKITTPESGSPAGRAESIELAKSSMSEEEFNQEYMCEPMNSEGLVYPGFGEENIVDDTIISFAKLKGIPLRIGVDFNISRMTAIICVKVDNVLYVLKEITQTHNNANTYSLGQEIKRLTQGSNVILYPDASGRNKDVSNIDPDNTNHQILRQMGFSLVFDHSGNPPIEDRTILLNSKIKPMSGKPSFYVHNSCKNLINGLYKRTYKNGKPIKDNITDHGLDCVDYVTWHCFSNRNATIQSAVYQNEGKSILQLR